MLTLILNNLDKPTICSFNHPVYSVCYIIVQDKTIYLCNIKHMVQQYKNIMVYNKDIYLPPYRKTHCIISAHQVE